MRSELKKEAPRALHNVPLNMEVPLVTNMSVQVCAKLSIFDLIYTNMEVNTFKST